MAEHTDQAPAAGAVENDAPPRGTFLTEWVVPVVLGLGIGTVAVWLWFHFAYSDAWKIAKEWDVAPPERVEEMAKELQALGPAARADVAEVFRDLPEDSIEAKIWIAKLLAGDPWFDTASLKEVLADEKAGPNDKRAAACALVDAQHKEVDSELVLPVLEAWMLDLSTTDHMLGIARLDKMWRAGMLSSQWESRMKRALLQVADRKAREASPPKGNPEYLPDDRAAALQTLQLGLPDDDVKKALWTVAKDETDDEFTRMSAVQTLSVGNVLEAETVPDWAEVARSKSDTIRQTVADNLHRATSPAFDEILVPLQFDAAPLARAGAVDVQVKRRRPTMFERFDELLEDHDEWVRNAALVASGAFAKEKPADPQRAGMILRLLEFGDNPTDVMGAALALYMMTGKAYGFAETDIHVNMLSVDEQAVATFMADKAGRKQAADQWRTHFPGAAWTDEDRARTLPKLQKHADPKNVERANEELKRLGKG